MVVVPAVDVEINVLSRENPAISKVSSVKPGVPADNIALIVPATARNSTFQILIFHVHSTTYWNHSLATQLCVK